MDTFWNAGEVFIPVQTGVSHVINNADGEAVLEAVGQAVVEDGFSHADVVTGELYDFNKDPQEWNNVFDDEKYTAVRQKMCGELFKHLEMYAKPRRRPDPA